MDYQRIDRYSGIEREILDALVDIGGLKTDRLLFSVNQMREIYVIRILFRYTFEVPDNYANFDTEGAEEYYEDSEELFEDLAMMVSAAPEFELDSYDYIYQYPKLYKNQADRIANTNGVGTLRVRYTPLSGKTLHRNLFL